MLQRTAYVDHLNVKVVSFASMLQVGDAKIVNSFSRALAVHREVEIFFGNEGNFSSYSVFNEPIPLPPVTEDFSSATTHFNPVIKVKQMDVIGISAASVLQIGNSEHVSMEARVKHIRQLLPRVEEQTAGNA
ncbi:spore germination protein GerPE [Neobacillus sp. SM06]|uniref:spore germination protein GerPE n=1 Tax=Neobacillus sp. SM06 TaxID=3422492 RepID=UPI003D2A50DF